MATGETTATPPTAATPRRAQRHLLLPVLHALQGRVGWISQAGLGYACRRLTVPPAEAYGVASFYALFALEPRAPVVAHVCTDIACMCSGSGELVAELERTIGPSGERPSNGSAIWLESPCLGLCEQAPAVLVTRAGETPGDHSISNATAADVSAALAGTSEQRTETLAPQTEDGGDGLRLLHRVGTVDPGSLDSYRSAGGYEALRTAFDIGPAGVIREVTDSKLLGRGGAAFPTGRKWDAVGRNPSMPHYIVCNADESEPGTFKDRVVIESDPFALIEALTIAGFATAAEHGYIYLRGEYPLAWSRLEHAIEQCRSRGLLGDDVMGRGFRFDIELRKGAGAYICGEETALFNSIEGYRGEPRSKPPFPVDKGLFAKPTVVNNVESLLNVLGILHDGGAAFARIGTEQSTGTRLFCLAGCVQRPGPVRGAVRRHAARGARYGRWCPRRQRPQGRAAGRRGRRLRRPGHARPRALVRGDARRRSDARLGRGAGVRPDRRPGADPASHRRLLPRRVLRAVRSLPGRHRSPAGGAVAPRLRPAARQRGRRDRLAGRDRAGDA